MNSKRTVTLADVPDAITIMHESFKTMAYALGKLRHIQKTHGLPPEACVILDDIDLFFERNGGDLDEREPCAAD